MTSNPESKSKPSNNIFLYLKSKHNKFQSQSYKFCTSICPNLPFHPQIKTTVAKHSIYSPKQSHKSPSARIEKRWDRRFTMGFRSIELEALTMEAERARLRLEKKREWAGFKSTFNLSYLPSLCLDLPSSFLDLPLSCSCLNLPLPWPDLSSLCSNLPSSSLDMSLSSSNLSSHGYISLHNA